jgi:transcriptional regulator with XRE-family HTH domain
MLFCIQTIIQVVQPVVKGEFPVYTTAVGTKRTLKSPRSTELGRLILDKRKLDSLTLRQAAEAIGIEHSSLSEIERGLRSPDFETIVKISDGLKVPLDELARSAAHDLGYSPPDTEEAYKTLAVSLSTRAEMYPDLRRILDHLAKTDPVRYRAFLVMFETWRREDEQNGEHLA